MKPPPQIDEAYVLYWAWSYPEPFFVMQVLPETGEAVPIHGLAICRYGEGGAVYRFSCNRGWETEGDSPWDSLEHAMNGQSAQYRVSEVKWIRYRGDRDAG